MKVVLDGTGVDEISPVDFDWAESVKSNLLTENIRNLGSWKVLFCGYWYL